MINAVIEGFLISDSRVFAVGLSCFPKQDVVVIIGSCKMIFDVGNKNMLVLAFLVGFFEQELLFLLFEKLSLTLSTRKF